MKKAQNQPEGKKPNPIERMGSKRKDFPKGVSGNPGGKPHIHQTAAMAYRDIGESELTPEELMKYAKAGRTSVIRRQAAFDYIHAYKGSAAHTKEINERRDGPIEQRVRAEVKTDSKSSVKLELDPEREKRIMEMALKYRNGTLRDVGAAGPGGDSPGHAGPDGQATGIPG